MTEHEKRSLQYRLARRFDNDPRRIMEIIREEIKKSPLTEEKPKGKRISIDDVKAEIDKAQEPYKTSTAYDDGVRFGLMLAYQIIDKYKAESEGE